MMINVLKHALNIIPKQKIYYKKFLNRTPNSLGNYVNAYSEKKEAYGSIQPAGTSLLYKLGIANTGDLYVVYVHANLMGNGELKSNDLIIDSHNRKYNIIKTDLWFEYPDQDWNKILVRRIKDYD